MNAMPIEVFAEVLGHRHTHHHAAFYVHLCSVYKQKLVQQKAPIFAFKPPPIVHGPVLVQRRAKVLSRSHRLASHPCIFRIPSEATLRRNIRHCGHYPPYNRCQFLMTLTRIDSMFKHWLIVVCLVAPPVGLSQVTMSGVELKGVKVSGTGTSGTWSDLPREATLTVGVKGKDQFGKDCFRVGGAAVLVKDSANRIFIATALHVFDNPAEHWAPESLQIRGWKDEQHCPYQDFGDTLELRKNGQPLFTASKSLDVAVIPAPQAILQRVANDKGVVTVADPTSIGGDDDIYDGADVFILGFPGLVGDEYTQRALMRSGIIAWTNTSGPAAHEFLVDARIFPGNSGGPVFSSAAGITKDAGLTAGKPTKLLGIVSQTINAKPELAFGIRLPKEAMVIGAAGVGVIEPAHALIDLMAQVP
jgi:hypothetical protein